MAESQSHAAGQSYAVHESMKLHPGLDLGLRHTADSFEDASEFAFEFLNEHDPNREGRVSALEIVRVGPESGSRETVWRYEYNGSQSAHQDPREFWGFDVNTWRGPDRAAYPAQ
jgi:hypothetical protein